jgi:hypothetical protein
VSRPSDEATVFGGLAIFGVVVGTGYWFVTYETIGSVLLIAFGIASGIASAFVWTRPPGDPAELSHRTGADARAGPAERGYERIPAPAFAPLIVGAGLAVIALGLALGALILPVGTIVLIIGARLWLEAAMREAAARDQER